MRLIIATVVAVIVLLGFSCMFVVEEGQEAMLLQFGRVVRDDYGPGVHAKLPLVQQVLRFDDRVLSLDPQPERYVTADGKSVNVEYYAKWRVVDRALYYRASRADVLQANQRLTPLIKDSLRTSVNALALPALIAADSHTLTDSVRTQADAAARKQLGISVLDMGIKRISLPDEVTQAVYKRMREERQQIANQLRADGNEAAAKTRAEADRNGRQLKADAERDATKIRGDGDAQAAAIYAQAYSQDPEFYAFYGSMAAYKKAFADGRGVLVLKPDSEFLRYFNESSPKH